MSAEPQLRVADSQRLQLLQRCGAAWVAAEWFPDPSCRRVVLTAERVADRVEPYSQLSAVVRYCDQKTWHARFRWPDRYQAAHLLTTWFGWEGAGRRVDEENCLRVVERAVRLLVDADPPAGGWRHELVGRMHDVFPPATVAFDPGWRTDAVVGLAGGMYAGRDFGPMPVLADALEDAGCADDAILAHCRGGGPHVRGCWVIDLALGKA